jgi:hypothetical protein
MKKPLSPRTIINSEGKMHYSESSQAWNVLKLKKELFEEFPDLKQKRSAFSYELTYFRDLKEFEKMFKEIVKKDEKAKPILMWLYKES